MSKLRELVGKKVRYTLEVLKDRLLSRPTRKKLYRFQGVVTGILDPTTVSVNWGPRDGYTDEMLEHLTFLEDPLPAYAYYEIGDAVRLHKAIADETGYIIDMTESHVFIQWDARPPNEFSYHLDWLRESVYVVSKPNPTLVETPP